jgi:hypothetical protein
MAKRKTLATQKARLRSPGCRYPGVNGKVVDYISHSIEDGALCVNVLRHCGCKDKPRAKRAKFYRHLRFINRQKYDRRSRKFCSGEYHSYTNMLRRCYGKNRRGEFLCENWGGKGIRVCDRWREAGVGFKNFLADMGPRLLGKSLDRKNPQDHYTPLNCQWGTKCEQVYNQTRYMWKDEPPPPIPSIRDTNEQIDCMFGRRRTDEPC